MALNLNDQTTNGNTLTNNGATEWTTDLGFSTGNTRAAALAQASTQYLEAADSTSLSQTGDMSLGSWVKFDSLPGANSGVAWLTKYTATGNQRSYRAFFYNAAGTRRIYFYTSTDGISANATNVDWTPSTNTWYHVAISYKASTHTTQFFVNGSQQGIDQDQIDTSIFNSTAVFDIGRDINGDNPTFDGKLDDIRVYNVTRTATDWAGDYNTEITTFTNLMAYWPFEAATTTTSSSSSSSSTSSTSSSTSSTSSSSSTSSTSSSSSTSSTSSSTSSTSSSSSTSSTSSSSISTSSTSSSSSSSSSTSSTSSSTSSTSSSTSSTSSSSSSTSTSTIIPYRRMPHIDIIRGF